MLVQGCYVVKVRLNRYRNKGGRCGEEACLNERGQLNCCDNLSNTGNCHGNERCDSYFKYCLRPFGEGLLNSPGCLTNQERATSSSNPNDYITSFEFSHSTVLGLNNPQNLSGLEGAYNVSH